LIPEKNVFELALAGDDVESAVDDPTVQREAPDFAVVDERLDRLLEDARRSCIS
jgi:hypothetical protein